MTTKLTIKNAASSNGDVHVKIKSHDSAPERETVLVPGIAQTDWVSTGHSISIHETWPTDFPAGEQAKAGELADDLIAAEVAVQDKMWGDANERADATNNQLMVAAAAQLLITQMIQPRIGATEDEAVKAALPIYPPDWEGLRSYGSTVANLVVTAAFIRSEIKRRVLLGEDTTRTKRGEPYVRVTPNMSAEDAAKS